MDHPVYMCFSCWVFFVLSHNLKGAVEYALRIKNEAKGHLFLNKSLHKGELLLSLSLWLNIVSKL